MAPPPSKVPWLAHSQVMIRPLAPHPLHPSSDQDSPILRLKFLLHVSFFHFHPQCHYSVFIISWFNITSSVSAGHCSFSSRLLLPNPRPQLPCPWGGAGHTCLEAFKHKYGGRAGDCLRTATTPFLACRPQHGSVAGEQGPAPAPGA